MKIYFLFVLIFSFTCLTACENTFQGMGKDIKQDTKAVQKSIQTA